MNAMAAVYLITWYVRVFGAQVCRDKLQYYRKKEDYPGKEPVAFVRMSQVCLRNPRWTCDSTGTVHGMVIVFR